MLLRRLISYRSVNLIYGSRAREGLLSGISKLSQAVTLTLGPMGGHVALEYEVGQPKITKDGVTVAKYFGLPGPLEDLGARLVMTSAHEANEYAGDGTTTTTLLTYHMVKAGLELLAKGAHPIMVKRGIDSACEQAVKYIRDRTLPVTREQEILGLAMVSTNHDKKLAEIITEAVLKAGKTGLVTVEEGSTNENRLVFSDGMVVNRGFSSPAFITEPGAADIRLESPLVLTLSGKISDITVLLPVLEKVKASQRSLVIVAEDVDAGTQSALLLNLRNNALTTCLVLYPGIGWNRDMIEDISCFTAAKAFSKRVSRERGTASKG
jgi:chaperonin GroEL